MKAVFIFIWVSLLGIFCYGLWINLDEEEGKSFYIKYMVEEDCNYKLPIRYTLVAEPSSGQFAIKILNTANINGRVIELSTGYLFLRRLSSGTGYISSYGASHEALLFKDSCKAKGFAKKFIESIPKEKEFIETK